MELIKDNTEITHNNVRFNWRDNLDVQKLLDVVSSIIADEYIQIAKKNPGVFKNNGDEK